MDRLSAGGKNDHTSEASELPDAANGSIEDSMDIEQNLPSKDRPESPAEQRKIVLEMKKEKDQISLEEGQTWYLLSNKWWRKNISQVVDETKEIEPINNQDLIDSKSEEGFQFVSESAREDYDYMFVDRELWHLLYSWFGGGPELPRNVVKAAGRCYVEVSLIPLKVVKSSALQDGMIMGFSRHATIGDFRKLACEKFGLKPEDVRVWDYHQNRKYKHLTDMNASIESSNILKWQPMLLEERGPDGKFPKEERTFFSSGGPVDPGTTGLTNLGNTCFMNSSLQCLSHTVPLTKYFLQGTYENDINEENPLGMKGEIANEYASLIKALWTGESSSISPSHFKHQIERYAPQFVGYHQHDSQELLGFLLDGLHEDLNRIKKKPYKELADPDGRPDKEVAEEMWNYHKDRNNSVIVDWFQGQLKSTLVCPQPDCKKVSITFDPFMYLSLPLPSKTTRTIYVTFFATEPTKKPVKYACEVSKQGNIQNLKESLSKMCGVEVEKIIICDVYAHKFYKMFKDEEDVDSISANDDICGYEIVLGEDVKHFQLQCSSSRMLVGYPKVLSVENASKMTVHQLYDAVEHSLQQFINNLDSESESDSSAGDGNLQPMEDEEHKETENKETENKETETKETENSIDTIEEPKTKKQKKRPFILTYSHHYRDYELKDDDSLIEGQIEDNETIVAKFKNVPMKYYSHGNSSQEVEEHESCKKVEGKKHSKIPLTDCIQLFLKEETLGPEDPWYCSNCKEHQQASKKFDIWFLPDILVIHLKRFSYRSRFSREKLNTLVDFPIRNLDMSPYIIGPQKEDPENKPIYNLYAVSNHYGAMGGGHYTAYAKNCRDDKWYQFNDSSVSRIEESELVSSSAYVLFYQRVNTEVVPHGEQNNDTSENNNQTDQMQQ